MASDYYTNNQKIFNLWGSKILNNIKVLFHTKTVVLSDNVKVIVMYPSKIKIRNSSIIENFIF